MGDKVLCELCEAIDDIVLCLERTDVERAVDDAFIAESSALDGPLVTFGQLRQLAKIWRAIQLAENRK